jgi:hypothetical protein
MQNRQVLQLQQQSVGSELRPEISQPQALGSAWELPQDLVALEVEAFLDRN